MSTLYPQISAKEWIELHGIEPITRPCRKCGKETTTTIPIAHKFSRGLISEDHGCGKEYRISTSKIRGELLDNLNAVAYGIKE